MYLLCIPCDSRIPALRTLNPFGADDRGDNFDDDIKPYFWLYFLHHDVSSVAYIVCQTFMT